MDYESRKAEILRDFFNSNNLKSKADAYFKGKHRISRETKIAEEALNQVYYHLSNYNAEKLVTMFDKNPNSLEAVSVVIMKRLFRFKKDNPDNPNNSFLTKLFFGSNYFDLSYVSPTDEYSESSNSTDNQNFSSITLHNDSLFIDKDLSDNKLDLIKERLTPKEIQFLEDIMSGEKFYKRKPPNSFKEYKEYVFNKIRAMQLDKPLNKLELIRTKLDFEDIKRFDIIFDDTLCYKEKMKLLKYTEPKYLSQRRILLRKIKALNI